MEESKPLVGGSGSHMCKCQRCGKTIPQQTRQMHEARCLRLSGKMDMDPEMADLYNGTVYCSFCQKQFSVPEFDEHLDPCSSKTDVCKVCGFYVRIRDMRTHLDSLCNFGATGAPEMGDDEDGLLYLDEQGRCRYCHNLIPEGEIDMHLDKCPERLEICNLCFNLVHIREKLRHEEAFCTKFIAGHAFKHDEDVLPPFGFNRETLRRFAPVLLVIVIVLILIAVSEVFAYNRTKAPVPLDFHP